MKYLLFIVLIHSVCMGQTTGQAAIGLTLPQVALLDIESSNSTVNLSITASNEAGDAPVISPANSANWINFTSAVTPSSSRRITSQLSGVIPSGTRIVLGVSSYSGTGAGTLGSRVPSLVLSNSAQNIITGIGGAYTGNGTGNGYNLSYTLEVTNFELLKQQSRTLTVIYTLVDN